MPSLTSCYFCGEAVGASLAEYDLPADASPDEQVSVTLCAGCKGKLTELLEEIDRSGGTDAGPAADPTPAAEAAASSDPDADAGVEPEIDEGSDLDPVSGDQEPIFADDGDAVLDEELPTGASAEERPFATEADDDPAVADDVTGDSAVADADDSAVAEAEADDSHAPADRDDGAIEASQADETEPVPSEPEPAPDESDAAESPEPAASGATDGDVDEDSGDAAASPPVEANAASGSGAATDSASGAGARSGDGPLADVSPRTYNRVVRLLQNREFPVDRADFEALATSAYELDHGECEAALDGAIEKGLLEEREGMLYRPE